MNIDVISIITLILCCLMIIILFFIFYKDKKKKKIIMEIEKSNIELLQELGSDKIISIYNDLLKNGYPVETISDNEQQHISDIELKLTIETEKDIIISSDGDNYCIPKTL